MKVMGHEIDLTASDGHRLSAYLAEPTGKARGGVVVIQEIFGVTRHIRDVADQYAARGYLAIAPAVFDRVERDVDVPYSDSAKGLAIKSATHLGQVILDIQAAVTQVKTAGKVGVVGYCWGGLLSYVAAARLPVDAAVSYYGGGTQQHLAEKPRAPMIFHFGEQDSHIPLSTVKEIEAAYPQGTYYLYPAEHGFNCTDRASFEPASAKLAFERSLDFFHTHVG
jgi:carboxymethylenebutenolidase